MINDFYIFFFVIWEIMLTFAHGVRRTHFGRRSVMYLLASENVGTFHDNNSRRSNGFHVLCVGLFPKFLLLRYPTTFTRNWRRQSLASAVW